MDLDNGRKLVTKDVIRSLQYYIEKLCKKLGTVLNPMCQNHEILEAAIGIKRKALAIKSLAINSLQSRGFKKGTERS